MKTHIVNTFQELTKIFEQFNDNSSYIFRGQADSEWKLLPKAGREEFIKKGKSGLTDIKMFRAWQRYAINYILTKPENDWEWYSLAQHYGLATRFLDWSKNPLVAAFFAVNENIEKDGAVFIYKMEKYVDEDDFDSPFEVKEFAVYYPTGISSRVIIQRGIFTISENPEIPIENILKNKLHKIIIPKEFRNEIKKQLDFYNINIFSIYQDLDSLSDYLNQYTIDTINIANIDSSLT